MPDNDKLITLDNLGTFKDNVEEEIDSRIQANSSMIANAYDSTSTYAVGDYAIYDGVLYRCKTAVSVAEPFDVAKWEDVKCAELNNEDEIEIVSHQTHTALTDAQIEKAKRGKLVVVMNGQYLTYNTYRESDNTIFFGHSLSLTSTLSSSTVPVALIFNDWGCGLSLTTKKFVGGGSTEFGSITHSSQNFFNNTDTPASTGKRLVRELNLARTQNMLTPNVYSASATYAVGDVVIYQNQLYRCTTAIGTAEAWDSTHWELTNVVELAKEKGANIVEISNTGTQTEEMAAKIQDADGILYSGSVYWKRSGVAGGTMTFVSVSTNKQLGIIYNTILEFNSSTRIMYGISANITVLPQEKIVSDFDATKSYSPGDIVLYNTYVYRCITAHTGAWSSSDFTRVILSDEIHSDIVVASAGVQTDAMDAKLRNCKGLFYNNRLYPLFSKSDTEIVFRSDTQSSNQDTTAQISYQLATKNLGTSTNFTYSRVSSIDGKNGSITLGNGLSIDNNKVLSSDLVDLGYSAYDATSTYSLGDIVVYDHKLYQCISAISTAEAWDSTHWQQVAVDVNNIVTITSTGVQSDVMAAKILNAKALVYRDKMYMLAGNTSSAIVFNCEPNTSATDYHYALIYNTVSKSISIFNENYSRVSSIGGKSGAITADASLEVDSSKVAKLTGKLPYLTTAPTADNTSGFLTIVVLPSEPDTRYSGYMYVITGSNS